MAKLAKNCQWFKIAENDWKWLKRLRMFEYGPNCSIWSKWLKWLKLPKLVYKQEIEIWRKFWYRKFRKIFSFTCFITFVLGPAVFKTIQTNRNHTCLGNTKMENGERMDAQNQKNVYLKCLLAFSNDLPLLRKCPIARSTKTKWWLLTDGGRWNWTKLGGAYSIEPVTIPKMLSFLT